MPSSETELVDRGPKAGVRPSGPGVRRSLAIGSVTIALVALIACGGQSKQEKAQQRVCDARADISKQVDTLKGLTISTATTTQIKDGLNAIGEDLKTITDAQGDLNADRKQEVEAANEKFASEVKNVVSTFGKTTSASQAKSQLETAFQNLATTYEQSFAKVDCSGT